MKILAMRPVRIAALLSLIVSGLFGGITPSSAQPALSTSNFRGVNWADERDNFVDGVLVLGGLSTADSYATTQAKADKIFSGFQNNLGANTVRMPVNYATVSGSYWNSYTGAIDMATSKGMYVILSYWEGSSSRDGLVDNLPQFWSMWQTIVNKYGSNSLVYFEPMNEPFGYSDADWKNVAAQWLSTYPNVPRGRVIISGAGYNQRLTTIGGDSRFNGTLISRHIYGFWQTTWTTEQQWRDDLRRSVGSYASRVIITEWGAPMTTGLDYNTPAADYFVAFMRGVAAEARALGLGTVYWPGIRLNDWYRLQELNGSGTNISLSTTNASGRDQLRYSWGLDGGSPAAYERITSRSSSKVVDVSSSSTADGANVLQWTWNGGGNQQWRFNDAGSGYFTIANRNSGKCLDVEARSTADGARIIQWTCGTGTNQQFRLVDVGGGYVQLVARHSGKCLDVEGRSTADGARIIQWACGTGTNQHWERRPTS
ncbi:MAG TPA: RICIN domain-containing protein [Roseiflexaceae bacterium]|nr:RICIN domain-containing protein [Roseiflexaceae bacterium]